MPNIPDIRKEIMGDSKLVYFAAGEQTTISWKEVPCDVADVASMGRGELSWCGGHPEAGRSLLKQIQKTSSEITFNTFTFLRWMFPNFAFSHFVKILTQFRLFINWGEAGNKLI